MAVAFLTLVDAQQGEACDLKKFGQFLRNSYVPNSAIIDCTASDVPASNYLAWMQQGIHVITPNKKLGRWEGLQLRGFFRDFRV